MDPTFARQDVWAAPPPAPYGYPAPPAQAGVPGYPQYPASPNLPPHQSHHRLIAITSVVVVLVLLAGIVVAVTRAHHDAAVTNSELAASRAKIQAELPRLEAWIAKDHELAFKHPVSPEVLSDKDFVAALDSGGGSSEDEQPGEKADPDDIGTTYTAMGLVKDPDAFYDADSASSDSDVVGFYDDQSKRLVVRGTSWTPSMEYTLVHELTHALQDQNYDLSAMDRKERTDDETGLTVTALVEGDAERVADDYYDQQPTAWQHAVDQDQGSSQASDVPTVDVYEGMPYEFGEHFVDGLVEAGGNKAVDDAFARPPTSSSQLLHPAEFAAGSLATPVTLKASDLPTLPGKLADTGVMGQLGLWSAVDVDDPDPANASRLDGWDGDVYVAKDGGDSACFVDEVHFSSATSMAAAVTYLQRWTKPKNVSLSTEPGDDVLLKACRSY